ncbi:hypothetical protein FJY71_02930 [candidate division WOR-3 bacterium]|nr:hypothetical protein [candidate division WOR-3 bacterium]
MLGRLLPALLVLAAAAEARVENLPKRYYQLNQRCQEVAQLLARADGRSVYDLFVPQFRADIPYARFDSALTAWFRGRRLIRVKSRLIDVRGLGGHASTFVYFKGEADYNYVYQSWLYTADGWRLLWLSNIMGQNMQFGNKDSHALAQVAQAALDHLASPDGMGSIKAGLALPETVVAVWPAPGMSFRSDYRPVRTLTPASEAVRMPKVPFYFRFSQIRVLGDLATCAVDVKPTKWRRLSSLRSPHSLQLFFDRKNGDWLLNSSGKKW